MRTWKELRQSIWQISRFVAPATDNLLSALENLLKNRTHEQIEYVSNFIMESIDFYFEEKKRIAIDELKENLPVDGSLNNLFDWGYEEGEVVCYPTFETIKYIEETSYLETENNTEDYEALLNYFSEYEIDEEDKNFPNGKEYEFLAILSLWHLNYAMDNFDLNRIKDETEQEGFPLSLEEWRVVSRENAVGNIFKAWNILRIAEYDFLSTQTNKDKSLFYKEVKASVLKENARKAGKAKQSPYEKVGTIAAVNELLEKHQALLGQHGGKAALCKMIRDSIAERAIPAYREPAEKTVMTWIKNFQNRKSTS
ncbi:hypothetical protein [Eikenella sp. Marseille-P7795]|uniref:hypothetical protein n=1 Tax=Eikenella sp. Marseille-P7795 TaxID=2866577 RepID=UPI001CE4B617|nr:hypothetical protein [Eikenella sp. Marseille-P7795]